jgi:hypothetical protein
MHHHPSFSDSSDADTATNLMTVHLPLDLDRVGMDLSKVTFPTFVLEPRSMLERITDFMAHPDLIFGWVCALVFRVVAASRHPRARLNPTRTCCSVPLLLRS